MAWLKVIGKYLRKAGKYVVKHPEQAVGVFYAGKEICDNVFKGRGKNRQVSEELDPQIEELLNHIDNLERDFESYKRENIAYQNKLKKTFLWVSVLEGIAVIIAIVLAIVL